jgi:broad specificity phosphatase PhoE
VTIVRMVRHGRAAAGWDTDPDPGLDELGRSQAASAADALAALGPLPIVSSPLRRCQETAGELAGRWDVVPSIDATVAEIPSPIGVAMGDRIGWLRTAMAGEWSALGDRYTDYRDAVAAWVASRQLDTVVFSHFVAINAAIGAALGDDRVVIASLDNCSVTTFEIDAAGSLQVIEIGAEADTLIR